MDSGSDAVEQGQCCGWRRVVMRLGGDSVAVGQGQEWGRVGAVMWQGRVSYAQKSLFLPINRPKDTSSYRVLESLSLR